MKKIFLLLVVCGTMSCKSIKGVQCLSVAQIPVTTIGLDGVPHTVYVPYCDTLKLIPKQPPGN